MWNRFKTLDPWLFVIPLVLLAISVVLIYSLTIDANGTSLFWHQLIFAAIGLVAMALLTFIDYRAFRGWALWLYLAGVMALLAVRFIGKSDFGAQRWINIGFFQFQPGELEKWVVIIALAALLSKVRLSPNLSRFFFAALIVFIPVVLVLLQPDLGTALVISFISLVMLVHCHLRRWQWLTLCIVVLTLLAAVALSFKEVRPFTNLLHGYQKDRLASFIEPDRDQSGSGYNVLQSVIAVGSGGLTGNGLHSGSQSQLNFLPVAYADFIFAALAEAWGFVGAIGVIILYGLLISRILQGARIAKDDFGMLLCIGVVAKLTVEILVNIGMNVRLMPVTGIPLPFLSYGGTTLLTNALCIGMVQSVVIRYKRLTF